MIYTSSRRPQDQTRGNTPGPSPSTLPAMGAKAFTASPPFPTKPKATSRSRPVRKALASHGSIAWDILIYFTYGNVHFQNGKREPFFPQFGWGFHVSKCPSNHP